MPAIISPVVGPNVAALVSPSFALSPDTAPSGSPGVAYYVSSITGTAVGVRTHTISSPFTVAVYRPLTPKLLGVPNPATGRIPNIPSNTCGFTVQKGVAVGADQPYQKAYGRGSFSIPAGAETFDAPNVAALFSFCGGVGHVNAASLFNIALTGAVVQ